MSETLEINSTLTVLHLSCMVISFPMVLFCLPFFIDCGIGDSGVCLLSKGLKVNSSLTKLVLWHQFFILKSCLFPFLSIYNRIGDIGVSSLSDSLKVNSSLTSLNLSNFYGLHAMRLLSSFTKQLFFYLPNDGNKIGNPGASSLSEALKVNSSLTELGLHVF